MLKTKLLMGALLAAGSVFGQVGIGISIGAPPPPRVMRVRPARPGPDLSGSTASWYAVGNRYRWHSGYSTRPPYAGPAG